MDVVVEVGGWEHECCGRAIERYELINVQCIRYTAPDGHMGLAESHHGGLGVSADERVFGLVVDLQVVLVDGSAVPVSRVPSGSELNGFDGDGHLEDPWTGEVIDSDSVEFLVTVQTVQPKQAR